MLMNMRVTSLSFLIGLFFLLIALILLVGYALSPRLNNVINLYAGIYFFLFGLFMMIVTRGRSDAE